MATGKQKPFSDEFSTKINDQLWAVHLVKKWPTPNTEQVGEADLGEKRITVLTSIPPNEILEILIHEALHALNPWKAEEVVNRESVEIAELLLRSGFILRRRGLGSR